MAPGLVGLYLPLHNSGGLDAMLQAVDAKHPGILALHEGGYDTGWFISSVVLSCLGFFMWPQYFGVVYASKSPRPSVATRCSYRPTS